jgi:hypothetical protein
MMASAINMLRVYMRTACVIIATIGLSSVAKADQLHYTLNLAAGATSAPILIEMADVPTLIIGGTYQQGNLGDFMVTLSRTCFGTPSTCTLTWIGTSWSPGIPSEGSFPCTGCSQYIAILGSSGTGPTGSVLLEAVDGSHIAVANKSPGSAHVVINLSW